MSYLIDSKRIIGVDTCSGCDRLCMDMHRRVGACNQVHTAPEWGRRGEDSKMHFSKNHPMKMILAERAAQFDALCEAILAAEIDCTVRRGRDGVRRLYVPVERFRETLELLRNTEER
jgi:hypothetical protein